MRLGFLILACLLAPLSATQAREPVDPTPRIAVISAFPPEITALAAATQDRKETVRGGTTFITGTLQGKPVVLFLSGMSMVNAAMTTQSAIDNFTVSRIVFSGIAGGVDPSLDIGDVIVPDQWSSYLETVFARETPDGFKPPAGHATLPANYGMMFPAPVIVSRGPGQVEQRYWFPADPDMLAVSRKVAGTVPLKRCVADRCLLKAPKVVVGGNGVSGQSFVDNAAFRRYAFDTFQARVLDMESAAVAQVAYVNGTPFIAFRSLSDLAGGDEGGNQVRTFFQLASDNSAAVVSAFIAALP